MKRVTKKTLADASEICIRNGASAVYLFGSRATGKAKPSSDIDLATRGLPPEKFFRTVGELLEFFGRPVDLIDLDLDRKSPVVRSLLESGELVQIR